MNGQERKLRRRVVAGFDLDSLERRLRKYRLWNKRVSSRAMRRLGKLESRAA